MFDFSLQIDIVLCQLLNLAKEGLQLLLYGLPLGLVGLLYLLRAFRRFQLVPYGLQHFFQVLGFFLLGLF